MKFQTERDVFADAVAWAARSLPQRPAIPVLAGLVLEVGKSALAVLAPARTAARASA